MKIAAILMLLVAGVTMALHHPHKIQCVVGDDTKECKVRRSSLTTRPLIPVCTATKTDEGLMRSCWTNLDQENLKAMKCGDKCVLTAEKSFCCCKQDYCNSRIEMN